MSRLSPVGWWRQLLALPNESRSKTLLVAFLVALVCATAVSLTAVVLKPLHEMHQQQQRQARMQTMLSTLPGLAEVLQGSGADSLQTWLVDLDSGAWVADRDPASYDFRAAIGDPELSQAIPRDEDIAGIGRRPLLAPIYLLRSGRQLVLLVVPVYGRGYQSTIHAYLALRSDLNTVAALQILEQGETPGLGSRITQPEWQSLWSGRSIADPQGQYRLAVAAGKASSEFEVDAIAGATRSTTGVSQLLRFWLGAQGYGPLLERLKQEER